MQGLDHPPGQRRVERRTQAQRLHALAGIAGSFVATNGIAHVGRCPQACGDISQQAGIDLGATGMGDGFALRYFGQLADHPANHHLLQAGFHGGAHGVAQKVAHLHKSRFGQMGHFLHDEFFGSPAGGQHHHAVAQRASHLHALHHAGPVGRRRVGLDDA